MPSVASQIRIDLIANAAQFNAGMKSASQGLGDFSSEYAKARVKIEGNRLLPNMKSEADAWKKGLEDVWKGSKQSGLVDAAIAPLSVPQKNRIRQDSLLQEMRDKSPWGNSIRTEMSREAAATASEIGKHRERIGRALGGGGGGGLGSLMSNLGGGGGGLGSLMSNLGGIAMNPATMVIGGASALVGGITSKVMDLKAQREDLARTIHHESLLTGVGSEQQSLLHGAGVDTHMTAKFMRAMSEQKPEQKEAFGLLGLDANKLKGEGVDKALLETADAFEKIRNPADRAAISMQLFGRGGAEMIPELAELREKMDLVGEAEIISPEQIQRVKAYDHAVKELQNIKDRQFMTGGPSVSTQFERAQSWLLASNAERGKLAERHQKEDYKIAHADELEAARVKQDQLAKSAKEYADQMERAGDNIKGVRDEIEDLYAGERGAESNRMRRKLLKELGPESTWGDKNSAEYQGKVKKYNEGMGTVSDLQAARDWKAKDDAGYSNRQSNAKRMLGSLKSPADRDKEEAAAIDELYKTKYINENQYWDLTKKRMEEFYRAAAGLDAEHMIKSQKSASQNYTERLGWLRNMRGDNLLTPEQATKEALKTREDYRKSVGVGNPLGDYEKSLKDLRGAYDNYAIDDEEFNRQKDKLRDKAVGEMMQDFHETSLTPAMQAGSREAYSVIAQTMANDPKLKIAEESYSKLDQIERNTRMGAAVPEKTLDF